ncbi:nitroreductase family protein [Niameybacter massiliensis]|uniref:nitroreductase family protein n=1 Tax=Niameybacter massiliensis TaxID=1658108 RepID=UPI0006B56487|nr:nitroreductase family protein [Niameybacter massiliensis]
MFKVDKNKCIACTQCIKDCPVHVIGLEEGKAVIHNEGCTECGHCVAICPVDAVSTDTYNMDEVLPYNKDTFTVGADNLLNFIKFRRSVRKFKDKEVEQDKVLKIIDAGRFTQTSRNSQDVSYIVVSEKLNELKALAYESLKQKGEAILANLTPETEHLKRYANLWIHSYNEYQKDPSKNDSLFFNAPLAILVTSPTPINGGLASTNMELMVNALGLGTFYSGFFLHATQDNEAILELLGLQDSKRLISCLVIGYPDVSYKRTAPRKNAQITWL